MVSNGTTLNYVVRATSWFRQGTVFRTAQGQPLVFHGTDFSLATSSEPATRGEILVLYATGLGEVDPPVPLGMPGPVSPLARAALTQTSVVVNETTIVEPLFAGLAPGLAGVYQVNFRLPEETPSGTAQIGMQFGGASVPIQVK